jgi:hypothetical protein
MTEPQVTVPNAGEREFEIGKDEAWFANTKRTYDEFLHESLESVRRNRLAVDKTMADEREANAHVRLVSLQAMQNAVETANLAGKQFLKYAENIMETANKDGKQATRHGDIAINEQWNPVQQGAGDTLTARAVSLDDASLKAIGALIATTLAETLSKAGVGDAKAA